MGGLASAIRNIDGTSPEMVVTNTRNPGKPEMTSIDKFIGTEFRSRYVNPTWIEGMKKEGYAGAGEMRSFVEYMWGWDATAPEVIDNGMWQETFSVYVEDKHQLGMKEFFETKSPFAYQDINARMVETVRKGYWTADAATQKKLLTEYIESVNAHGASGSEVTSGNARLTKYVIEQGKLAGIPVPALEGFQRAMEKAMGGGVASAAQNAEAFAKQNDARPADNAAPLVAGIPVPQAPAPPVVPVPDKAPSADQIKGFLMEQQERVQAALGQTSATNTPGRNGQWDALYIAVPVVALLVIWRRRRRSAF
jgi:cobaltochelatase CobN